MFKLSIVFSFSNSRTIHYLETVEQTIILAWVATLLVNGWYEISFVIGY
jgi:hypothetical protein